VKIPVAVIAVVAEVVSNRFTRSRINSFVGMAGLESSVLPDVNKLETVRFWLQYANSEYPDPVERLGVFIAELMEGDYQGFGQEEMQALLEKDRARVQEVLGKHGLTYVREGRIVSTGVRAVSRTLEELIEAHDLSGLRTEFDRIAANIETDPPAAVTASCALLESLFKIYIVQEKLEMPSDKSIGPLWKVVRNHLTLEPDKNQDDDIRKVLVGLAAIVDGVGALRTHQGSAHGHETSTHKIKPRHARLASHASFTIASFIMEKWIERP